MKTGRRPFAEVQSQTRHLSCTQFGVYTRLMDHYCQTEKPLPADVAACCQIVAATSDLDRQAVEAVLALMFVRDGDCLRNAVAEAEIAGQQPRIKAAQANGARGGRPKKTETKPKPNPTKTQQKPSGLFDATDAPEWLPAKEWADFLAHRKAMRGVPFTEAAREGVIRELDKFRCMGHDPAALLTTAVTRGWRTVFEPKGVNGYANGHAINRQEAQEDRNRQVASRWLASQEDPHEAH